LRQIEKILPKSDLSSVSLWIKDVVCENKYQNIDNLVYSMPTTILESVESRKNLISNLTQKPQVKESINLPIETIFNIAGKQLSNYIETLDESSKTDLAKVLMTEDTDLEIEYNELKNKTISSLNGVESEDDVTKTKLQETIGQIEKDEYSKINYVRLFALYNNIQ
jgi:myo-inositol-1-phosphate synthase